jgi:penicillin V acylase-like amidase (Ntn superfamily)
MKHRLFKAAVFSVAFLFSSSLYPCTTFSLQTGKKHCFGKSYDFMIGNAHVCVNKRNLLKVSPPLGSEKKFAWVSRYGSITFNQFGKEFPCGGMNESGLIVDLMMLDEEAYPDLDSRFGLTELQWIQYMLDNFSSVDEVCASDNSVRISLNSIAPIHLLISDKNGMTATIEYIDKKNRYPQKLCASFPRTYQYHLRRIHQLYEIPRPHMVCTQPASNKLLIGPFRARRMVCSDVPASL